MLTYLMLLTALFNAVCLCDAYFFAIDFCECFFVFMNSLGLLTQFVYFKYYLASRTVPYSIGFHISCSHRFINGRAMCSLEK